MKAKDIEIVDEKDKFLAGEYVRRVLEETIEFDEKMLDPEFLRKIRHEEEKIKNTDLCALYEGNDNVEKIK